MNAKLKTIFTEPKLTLVDLVAASAISSLFFSGHYAWALIVYFTYVIVETICAYRDPEWIDDDDTL